MKKLRKVLFIILLVPMVLISCAFPASADMFWEPDYEFWREHHDEVEDAERAYEFAGKNGSVSFYSRPGETVLKEFPNGENIYVKYTWFDGTELWGCSMAKLGEDNKYTDGWVRMEDMLLIYDSKQFFQEHESEIERNVDLSAEFEAVKCFPYPNGPERDTQVLENPRDSYDFDVLYTDEVGLRWGGQYFQRWTDWYCIDEPLIEGAAERKYVLTPEQEAKAAAKERQKTLILAAVLVAAVVIVTVVLIRKIPKRQKATQQENEDTKSDV